MISETGKGQHDESCVRVDYFRIVCYSTTIRIHAGHIRRLPKTRVQLASEHCGILFGMPSLNRPLHHCKPMRDRLRQAGRSDNSIGS